jgi:dihydrofolate reductase
MIISIIAAMDEKRAIGRGNRLPWHISRDLERFRSITLGHPVIMGRKTYESIGAPLPGRTNIIITRREDFPAEGCIVVHDLDAALAACAGAEEVFFVGGAEIFREAMSLADRVYLTIVHTTIDGDSFFPELREDLSLISRESAEDIYPIEFLVYERKGGKREG